MLGTVVTLVVFVRVMLVSDAVVVVSVTVVVAVTVVAEVAVLEVSDVAVWLAVVVEHSCIRMYAS
jgi:hypothetical protein